jgi:hypothetical protein
MEELGRQNPRAKTDLGKWVFLINLDGQLLHMFWSKNNEKQKNIKNQETTKYIKKRDIFNGESSLKTYLV